MINYLKKSGKSKIQETLAEYAFLKDLLIDGVRKEKKVLISRSDFDEFGYDVLVQIEGEQRVVKLQLKAFNGKARNWDVHKSLIEDPEGNVVVIKLVEGDNSIDFEYSTLYKTDGKTIIERAAKIPKENKCKVIKGDLVQVEANELLKKVLNYDSL